MLTDEALFFDCKKKEKQVMSVFFVVVVVVFSVDTCVLSLLFLPLFSSPLTFYQDPFVCVCVVVVCLFFFPPPPPATQ